MRRQVKFSHGGARVKAGKKPMPADAKRITKTITVSVEFSKWMASLASTKERPDLPGASSVIEAICRRSPAFKKWSEGRNG